MYEIVNKNLYIYTMHAKYIVWNINGILKGVLDGILKVYDMVYYMYTRGIENGISKAC